MKTVEVKYKKTVYSGSFPTAWNELTKEQLLYLALLLCNRVQPHTLIVNFLSFCLNLPGQLFFKIKNTVLAELTDDISFVVSRSKLTIQLLPMLQVASQKLYGPESALQNLCFEQFFWHAEPYYTRYVATQEPQHVNNLIASLYVIDKQFNSDHIPHIGKMVENFPETTKLAILLFYQGCRGFLAAKFPKVFSAGVKTAPDEFSPIRMLTALNNNDMTRNAEIKRTNLYEALVQIEENISQSEKLKTK